MERTKNILIIILLISNKVVFAQSNPKIYHAYVNNDMSTWKNVIDSMENVKKKSNASRLELLNYQYGYIGWCLGNKDTESAEKYSDTAKEHLQYLEKSKYNLPEIYAYKSAFIGYEIGLSPFKAPFIGTESIKYAKKAIRIDNHNALGYIQLGNIEFYMPRVFGGSKQLAIEYYLTALGIMEENPSHISQNWNYLSLLATLINAYLEVNDYKNATHYCLRALMIEPDFDWVKNELYPKSLKLLKSE